MRTEIAINLRPQSANNGIKRTKTKQNIPITRWVDRLLLSDFKVIDTPGSDMGLADYLSRKPSPHKGNK